MKFIVFLLLCGCSSATSESISAVSQEKDATPISQSQPTEDASSQGRQLPEGDSLPDVRLQAETCPPESWDASTTGDAGGSDMGDASASQDVEAASYRDCPRSTRCNLESNQATGEKCLTLVDDKPTCMACVLASTQDAFATWQVCK